MAKTDDDALQAALAQFNEGIGRQQAEDRAKKAVEKADRKKQQAAAHLKKLQGDPDASAEDKAAADAAYREAVDEWNRRRAGEDDPPATVAEEATDTEPSNEAPPDEEPSNDTDEEPSHEEPSDEEPSDEEPSDEEPSDEEASDEEE